MVVDHDERYLREWHKMNAYSKNEYFHGAPTFNEIRRRVSETRVQQSPIISGKVKSIIDLGRRDHLKKVASFTHSGENYRLVQGMNLAADYGDVPLTFYACITGMTVFFQGTEEEVLSRLGNPSKKVKKQVPEKVAIKMLELRIRRVQDSITGINKSQIQHMKNNASNLDLIPDMEWRSRDEIVANCHALFSSRVFWDRKLVDDLKTFIYGPEVTDEVIGEVWKLILAKSVMEN